MRKEIKIGIFAVAMLLCAWAGIRFLSGIDLFSRNRVYYASYDKIDGVQSASPVFINGVKVGTVTDIRFDPMKNRKVVLALTVKRQYGVPSDSEAGIRSDGLLGSKAICITLGSSQQLLQNGDTIRSRYDADLMETAGSELDFLKQKITQVTTDLSTTLGNLNSMLEQNADNVEGTMKHLKSITGNVDAVLSARREGLIATLGNLAEFTQMLKDSSAHIDSMMTGLSRFSTELSESHLADNLARTSAELNDLLNGINSGEGSLGKLAHDEELYGALAEASGNLSRLLADLKEHPSRYVHFSLFGRSEAKEAERMRRDSVKAAEKAAKAAAKAAKAAK